MTGIAGIRNLHLSASSSAGGDERSGTLRDAARAYLRTAGAPGSRASQQRPPHRYRGVIERLAPGCNPVHVEAWMLLKHGSLDRVGTVYFAREVTLAAQRAIEAGPRRSEELAQELGLPAAA